MRGLAALVLAVVVAALLWRRWRRDVATRRGASERLYTGLAGLFEEQSLERVDAVGFPRLSGRYRGHAVHLQPVVDTLAVRRLPALWLQVTVRTNLPIDAKLDLMMRPNGPTTFSNFDHLPDTLPTPAGFPYHAVLRSDDAPRAPPAAWFSGHLDVFDDTRAKELLIAPQGLRLVWLLAEGDRARYGVFRQAEFGDVCLDPALIGLLLEQLLAIEVTIRERVAAAA